MPFIQTETPSGPPSRIFWPLMALVIVLAADLAAFFICRLLQAAMFEWNPFYIAAPAAALLVGIPAWHRFVIVPGRATIGRGIAIGAFGSIIAHPVMWMLLQSFAPPMAGFSQDWTLVVVYILSGLLVGGWITTPLGILAGMLLIRLQRALTPVGQPQVSQQAEGEGEWRPGTQRNLPPA